MGTVSAPLSASTQTSPQMRGPQSSGTGEHANLGGEVSVVDFECEGWVKFRRLVVCPLEGRVSVRAALQEAAREFERLFGGRAGYGFIRKMPVAVGRGMWEEGIGEWGVDSGVVLVGDLVVLEVDWILERCVAVGGKAVSG